MCGRALWFEGPGNSLTLRYAHPQADDSDPIAIYLHANSFVLHSDSIHSTRLLSKRSMQPTLPETRNCLFKIYVAAAEYDAYALTPCILGVLEEGGREGSRYACCAAWLRSIISFSLL